MPTYDTHEARLYEIDLTGWSPGAPVTPRQILEFPKPWAGLNGGCLVAHNVLLAAGMAGLIWRVDLGDDASASARIWLQHDTMKNRPGQMKPEQPGTNGVQFDRKTGYLYYYTTTSQQMMLRVQVDPATQDPIGLPEFIAGGREWDDLLIDEENSVVYATTHRENTIDRVRLAHDGNREGRTVIAGDPFTETLVGPSAGAARRATRAVSPTSRAMAAPPNRPMAHTVQARCSAPNCRRSPDPPLPRSAIPKRKSTMADRQRRLETVSADATKIVTCIDEEGPTLVMLPSYGRDGLDDFDHVSDRIVAACWRVLRPQPRGIAGSARPMQGIDLKDLAGDVACVIRQLCGAPAVVLGHAFGNFVARVTAVEHPELVRGIILAAATSSPAKVPPEVNKAPFVAGDPTRPEEERLAALRLAFFAPGYDPRPWLDGWYPETLAMQHGAVEATKLDPYWGAGTAPILEITPRFDAFNPPALWSEMHDKVGDRVTTVIIDDASHALFPEQPDRVAEAVRRWIARL